jgi:hypothetical protein
MPLKFFVNFDPARWEVWIVLIAGLTATGLTLLVGARWYWRRPSLPPPPDGASTPPVDPFVYGSATNRRNSLRRRGNFVKIFISDEEAQAIPWQGWVVDRSVSGLRLSVTEPVTVDSILSVRTTEEYPWVQVRVKNCSSEGDNWELGCQFVRTPPWNMLLQFG